MQHNATLETFAVNGFARQNFPQVPDSLIREWTDDTYPAGDWAVDRAEFAGLEAVLARLDRFGLARFVAIRTGLDRFEIREACPVNPNLPNFESPNLAEYPQTPERGPVGRWDRTGESFAIRGFVYSRCDVGTGRTFEVYRTGDVRTQTVMRVC